MKPTFKARDIVAYTTPSGRVIRAKVFAFASNGAVRLCMVDKPESSMLIQPKDFDRITLVEAYTPPHRAAGATGEQWQCLDCGHVWRGRKHCPVCDADYSEIIYHVGRGDRNA